MSNARQLAANLPREGGLSNRNLIINGNFDVWQRGTSFSNSNEYTADRWVLQNSGASITVTREEFALGQTDVPDNPKYYLRYAVTTGNDNARIAQRIEGVSTFAGDTVTLTYWARHSSGTLPTGIRAKLRQEFGTGGTPSSTNYVDGSNITLTSSWQKFTQTFNVPSVSGKTLGTNGNDYLGVALAWQIGTETAAYTIDIAQVQLEVGTATPFEHRSYSDQLQACQRYFQSMGDASNTSRIADTFGWTTSIILPLVSFPVEMRAAPSFSATDGTLGVIEGNTSGYTTNISSNVMSKQGGSLNCTTSAGLTANNPYMFSMVAGGYLRFDAEL